MNGILLYSFPWLIYTCLCLHHLLPPKIIISQLIKRFIFSLHTFDHMETPKENKNSPWLSVPQFGDWDQKGGSIPDYSMDFTKIREMRKLNKRDVSRASLGNEEELVNPFHNQPSVDDTKPKKLTTVHSGNHNHTEFSHHPPSTRRGIFSCFNCCVKA